MPYKNPKQQAAIAISMKKAGKTPKEISEHMKKGGVATKKKKKQRVKSMSLGIILSQPCVNDYLRRLKPVQRVASLDNGQQEKHRCWQENTKQQVEDTSNDER
jgi:hypothetical protein